MIDKTEYDVQNLLSSLQIGWMILILLFKKGSLKQGPCTCSTSKAFNLTYLHVLRASPFCIVMLDYRLTLHARTNVPLSSAQLSTSFQQPLYFAIQICCSIWPLDKTAQILLFWRMVILNGNPLVNLVENLDDEWFEITLPTVLKMNASLNE